MKWFIKLMLPALVLASCSKEAGSPVEILPESTGERQETIAHGSIALGDKLENPYSVRNVSAALASVYPTRADVQVPANARYVRFLPKDMEEYSILEGLGLDLFDHPLDYQILQDGDYYHDPSIPEGEITWQYAVVPVDFSFPETVRHEVIEDCFIPEEGMETKGFADVDWNAVERKAFEVSGNGKLLVPETRSKAKPSGRISIMDDKLGKAVGISCVKMVANVFVKVSTVYTDADGKYSFPAKFSAKPRYSICFQNKLGFTIGLNLILVPASVSTLGKDDPDGIDVTVDSKSDNTLFRRCAVNNAAYDYFQQCTSWGITQPPKNTRFWILNILRPSCTLMMHHGAILDTKLVSNYLGMYKAIVRVFAPDIVIGSKGKNGKYSELYTCAIHELAHSSHFEKVGNGYWNKFATYILTSYLVYGSCYGTGNGDDAGYCAVGEMWAYHVENMVYESRYGVNPHFGSSYWFKPSILDVLEDGGVTRSEIFSALTSEVTDVDALKKELLSVCPAKKTVIDQAFKPKRK